MNAGIIKIWQNIRSGFLSGRDKRVKTKSLSFSPVSQIILDTKTVDFIRNLRVKDIMDFHMHYVSSNEQIRDCLDVFLDPFKTSVLVKNFRNSDVMGVLNLQDIIAHLKISFDLKSMDCPDFAVNCIMDTNFVPLEYSLPVSKIFVDILNCECPMHPVYDRTKLVGVLYKETILDMLKVQMLEEALTVKQMPPYSS